MNLRKDLRYVVLDFETTGTDKKYDEIIQIWIVEFDVAWNIIQEYASYIKPIHTEKLHDIVDMITWISIETLLIAPTRDEIKPTVETFFWPNTVIIWHSVGFDIAFLERYWIHNYYTSIDTLSLVQTCKPYLQSYALEIVANAFSLTGSHKASYHDALVDSTITWKIFFMLLKILGHILHTFPYVKDITKRTPLGISQCLELTDEKFLIDTIPQLQSPTLPIDRSTNDIIPIGKIYLGNMHFDDAIKQTTSNTMISWFAQHQKVLLAQKRLAQQGIMYHIHEPQTFDTDLLHRFLTQKQFTEAERKFIIKYHVHVDSNHKSFHAINPTEFKILKALLVVNQQRSTRKLYTHADIFTQVSSLSLNPDSHIVLYDKEWLLDSRRKWRFQPVDLYQFADTVESCICKYTLLGKDTIALQKLLSWWYIFVGIFTAEAIQLSRDCNKDICSVDDFWQSTYFFTSRKLANNIAWYIQLAEASCDTIDFIDIQQKYNTIVQLLQAPLQIHAKWSDFAQWVLLQPVDSFASWDDIERLFDGYAVTYVSVLDTWLPELHTANNITPKTIVKRKDLVVSDTPKICIIAPSKAAAQQLVMSLHKSKVYKDCFLWAEHITGWAGKIIQQVLQKKSYILIGGYWFCLQCIAHGIEFDSISALDIINQWHINPFMDISYYAANKKF